ncbi:HNH endonuclease family protein [Frankia sp. CiP3]|uniref:HNH endonuclease family protein n=1 Tax=Frankia sp. CiP3 TaxID=2880971 RepID=UPI001EF6835E|nr:HNH endonuclease family protein [Frankia sp. CiP3]
MNHDGPAVSATGPRPSSGRNRDLRRTREPRPRGAPGTARALLALCLGLVFVASACGSAGDASAASAGAVGGAGQGGQAAAGSALATLRSMPVHAATNSPPYRRDKFGDPWQDVDGNGCDTRNDILRRDLTLVTVRQGDPCIVLTGELKDPYTNRTVRFNRARDAAAVQIDHVIALADSWRTGAASWPSDKLVAFANDPENLLAVDGPTNQDKSDDDAAQWLPPNQAYRCQYVARQIGVKARYGLWLEPAERDAMAKTLAKCPAQPVLGGNRRN